MSESRLRALMRPLRYTPLHPQWLVLREERELREWVRLEACGRVLDIGCAGSWARTLLRDCDYVGLDFPATATKLYGTRPEVFADAAALPFAGSQFHTVLLLEVLEHVREASRVLTEIYRVLKPGGKLLLSMPFLYPLHDAPHDYRRYTAPGLKHALAESGLRVREVRPLTAGLEAAASLVAIGCAEGVLEALRNRSWRLVFAPLLIASIPLANVAGWMFARMAGHSRLMASGHALVAVRPE